MFLILLLFLFRSKILSFSISVKFSSRLFKKLSKNWKFWENVLSSSSELINLLLNKKFPEIKSPEWSNPLCESFEYNNEAISKLL